MRIVFVQTYSVYHDLWSTEQWLALENRDKYMPGVVASLGHEVELWAVDKRNGAYTSTISGLPDYPIRIFAANRQGKRTKFDYSDDLIKYSREFPADLYVLKGVDGGVGVRLIERSLIRDKRPFAFVIGGKFYTRYVPHAVAVLYETEEQRRRLNHPQRFWRRPVREDRLIRLGKVVDLEHFRPLSVAEHDWDVLALGRIVPGVKHYDALGELPRSVRIAVAGDGPALNDLRDKYPWINWLGRIEHHRVPELFSRAKIFFHTGMRDYYPRVLAEAAACGVPAVAFGEAIAEDVLPASCGIRVTRQNCAEQIISLLENPLRREALSEASRKHAMQTTSIAAMRPAILEMVELARAAL